MLWIVQSLLSQPASIDADGNRSPGGKLAQLRDAISTEPGLAGRNRSHQRNHEAGHAGACAASPCSCLWNSAHQYQKNEDWTSLQGGACNQIIGCSRIFFPSGIFRPHNLSYNISVEFDDYRDRFYWVMKGIDFLKDGCQTTTTPTRDFWPASAGSTATKLAAPTSTCSIRRLFKKMQEDKGEKHTDNWLVGYDWYVEAQKAG